MKVVGAGLGAEPGRIERPRKARAPEEASREDRELGPSRPARRALRWPGPCAWGRGLAPPPEVAGSRAEGRAWGWVAGGQGDQGPGARGLAL